VKKKWRAVKAGDRVVEIVKAIRENKSWGVMKVSFGKPGKVGDVSVNRDPDDEVDVVTKCGECDNDPCLCHIMREEGE